jgi:hypothetical protein
MFTESFDSFFSKLVTVYKNLQSSYFQQLRYIDINKVFKPVLYFHCILI